MKIKPFFRLLLCSAALILFAACTTGDEDEVPVIDPVSTTFMGDLVIDQNDGTTYTDKDVKISVNYDTENGTATMIFYQVKFAERMPVRLDMTVSGVSYTVTTSNITIAGNNIVPYAMGGPFVDYTITNLSGTVTGEDMTFTMKCGPYPVSFKGKAF